METVYRIKIRGKEYNENYTFADPTEGSIEYEIAGALKEIAKGNIDKLEVEKEK